MISDNHIALVDVFDNTEAEMIETKLDAIAIRKIFKRMRSAVMEIVIKDEGLQNVARDKDRALLHLAIGMLSTHTPFTATHPEMVLVYLERAYKEYGNVNGKS